jgi:hypothetical protein
MIGNDRRLIVLIVFAGANDGRKLDRYDDGGRGAFYQFGNPRGYRRSGQPERTH